MHLTKSQIEQTDHLTKINLINSITGIKPANLIGTISNAGQTNLAVFSSVVHLGSDPALIGFISRPTGEVPRHTVENILENGEYTINHIHHSFTERAHATSAKFDRSISEFEKCGFNEEFLNGFSAPFVKECQVKMGMKFLETIPIKINGTMLVIGEIQHIMVPNDHLNEGHIDLEVLGSAGISGLNSYYRLEKIDQYPYARPSELPDFKI